MEAMASPEWTVETAATVVAAVVVAAVAEPWLPHQPGWHVPLWVAPVSREALTGWEVLVAREDKKQ
jgi:hypothetical protein